MRVPQALVLVFLNTGCQMLFPTEAGDGLAHFATTAPATGTALEALAQVQLISLTGERIQLPMLHRGRPLVVRLGSYTCPVYRYRRFDFRKLRSRYADQVDFVVIYTREAHPNGAVSPYADEEWVPWINRLARINVPAHQELTERIRRADIDRARFESDARYLVDDMANTSWSTFGRAPSAAFIFDAQGRLALRQAWVEPSELSKVLDELLLN